jgi:hypothetical protein
VDAILFGGARLWHQGLNNQPGQPECDTIGEEGAHIKWEAHMSHQHQIFLKGGQSGIKQGINTVLPDWQNDRQFLYQALAGIAISEVPRLHYES